MNPTKTLLPLLIFLLPITVNAADVDGKSLVCKHSDNGRIVGFMFIDGTVTANEISEINLQYRITKFGESVGDKSYRETVSELRWFMDYWVLNRKTLDLVWGTPESEESSKEHHTCEVFESFDDYHDKLVEIKSEKQKHLEEEMQDNKI